jgi:hypothetical protein
VFLTISVVAFATAGLCGLAALAMRDHRAALRDRAGLLAPIAGMFDQAEQRIGPDGYPSVTGRLHDRRQITVELLADTLVTRRLPQLWLTVTLREPVERARPSIGALARPTGAEFYAVTPDLPERLEHTPGFDGSVMVRGSADLTPEQRERASGALHCILADKRVKEAVVTPRGARIVRQACEGDRGAHLILRQVRFDLEAIGPELVLQAVADADRLCDALVQPASEAKKRLA